MVCMSGGWKPVCKYILSEIYICNLCPEEEFEENEKNQNSKREEKMCSGEAPGLTEETLKQRTDPSEVCPRGAHFSLS